MEYLSWLFFCLSPFALFCSEDGNGLILCPVFIILGFICKYAGNSSGNSSGATIRVEPQEFWEWHYKNRMSSTLDQKDTICDELMAHRDQEARSWATTICGYHNAWVPPEEKQEQIARENGVITEQMLKLKTVNKDRIQIGKYFLMEELEKKYYSTKIGKGGREKSCYPQMTIKKDKYKIKTSNYRMISEYCVKSEYNKSIKEMWDSLTNEEKKQAIEWFGEYEKRLIELCNEYVCGNLYKIDVNMDF